MPQTSQPPGTDSLIVQPLYQDLYKKSVDTTTEFRSIALPEKQPVHQFFTSHHFKKIHPDAIPATQYQPEWVLGILFICVVFVAWSNFFYHKRLRQIFMAPYSKRFLNQLVRDGNLFSERISVVLGTAYMLILSMLLYQVCILFMANRTGLLANPLYLYIACLGILVIYWLVKIILIRLVGLTFKTTPTTNEYLLNVLIFNIITGLSILPFLITAIYLKLTIFVYISVMILGIFIIFRFFRGFLIGISLRKFSYLFLFVYLCSLEFLPLIVLLKFFLIYYSTTIQVK
jgi:hypothetical protein